MHQTLIKPGKRHAGASVLRFLGIIVALLLLGFVALILINYGDSKLGSALLRGELRELHAAQLHGPPLRSSQGGADRIYLLTTQDETIARLRRGNSNSAGRRMMHVDLWAVDAGTMKLAWRKRVHTFENKALEGFDLRRIDLLGPDGKTLWLLVGDPLGVSLVDGSVLADGARIDARNPRVAGKRVNQLGYIAFGRHGLQLTLDDASQWRIDGATLEAQPRDTPSSDPKAIVAPAPVHSTNRLQVRGLPIGERWLGVLTEREATALRNKPVIAGRDPNERPGAMMEFLEANHVPQGLSELPQPYRLWGARLKQVSAAPSGWPKNFPDKWGTRPKFSDYVVLPDAPSFLMAGLLRENADSEQALWYTAPDSVLVLHHDKLGEAGRLKLARVAGPGGRVVWDAPLQIDNAQALMRDERVDVVFLGTEPVAPDARSGPGMDPDAVLDHDAKEKLVRVAIGEGTTATFDLTAESLRRPVGD